MNTIETARAIRAGKLSAKDHIQSYLDAIKKDNTEYNIFLYVNPDAISDAKRIDEKIKKGQDAGMLAGLGIAIKANINVKGMPISCASKVLEDYVGTYDADVVRRIKEEDGIILGIVNCDEFASGSTGKNSAFGATSNPACPSRVTGGSSSGSGAAVAAKMCDIALGSDTGGSIRSPASHCGVFGIKPSYGRVSRYGLIDLAMSFDQIGPLARDLEGCTLMMEVISGHSANDPITDEKPVPNYTDHHTLENVKVATSKVFEDLCSDRRIYDATVNKAKSILSLPETKITLKHVRLAVQTYYPIVYVEFFSATRKLDGRRYGKKFEDAAGPEALRRVLGGQEISKAEFKGKYYRRALQVLHLITEDFERAFKQAKVILLPTTPALPPKQDEDFSTEEEYASDAFTIPANLAGLCAGVVPMGTVEGVPVGVQVFCKAFDEKLLFSIMNALTTKMGGASQAPH